MHHVRNARRSDMRVKCIRSANIRSQIDTFVPGREMSPPHGKWSWFPAIQRNKTALFGRDVQDTERVITERKLSLHCQRTHSIVNPIFQHSILSSNTEQ